MPQSNALTDPRDIFVAGGTGYIGRELIPSLLARGHRVRALARPASVARVPAGAEAVVGNALDAESVFKALRPWPRPTLWRESSRPGARAPAGSAWSPSPR
jgi:NAD(P)-dependent dehydrogenase (short-subunit alcohol dehydrogenase family)